MTSVSGTGSNRSAYLLIADGRRLSFRERWRAVGAVAYQSAEAADVALAPWVAGLVADPGEGLMAVDPATVVGRVVALVDGSLDEEATELHLLHAKGHSAVFAEAFESLCGRVFTDRARAEAEAPLHAARCCEPALGLGMNYAKEGTVEVTVQTIVLAPASD